MKHLLFFILLIAAFACGQKPTYNEENHPYPYNDFNKLPVSFSKFESVENLFDIDSIKYQIIDGKLNGDYIVFRKDGTEYFKGFYKSGKKEGDFIFNTDSGMTEKICFREGKLNGIREKSYLDGREEFGYYDNNNLIYYRKVSAEGYLEETMLSGLAHSEFLKNPNAVAISDTLEFKFSILYSPFTSAQYLFTIALNEDTVDIRKQHSLTYDSKFTGAKSGRNELKLFVSEIDTASQFVTGTFRHKWEFIAN